MWLRDMYDAVCLVRDFASNIDRPAFDSSPLHQSAVVRQLEIIGEAAKRVSDSMRIQLHQIPWVEIIGMRNRLVHD